VTTVQPGSEEKPEVTKVQPTEKPIDTEINEEVSRFEIPIKINSTHLELFPDFLQNNTLWDKFSNNTILNQLYNLFGTTDVEATSEVTMVQPESKHDLITEVSIEKPIDSESNEEIVRLAIPININSTHLELFPNFLQNNTLWDKFSNNTILTQLYTLFGQVEKTSEDEESFTVDDDQPEEQEESLRLSFPNKFNSTHIEYITIFPNYLVNTTLWNQVTNSTLWNTFTNLFTDTLTNLVEETETTEAPEVKETEESTTENESTTEKMEEISTESETTLETEITESPDVKGTTKINSKIFHS
jgi:hypothetical protein